MVDLEACVNNVQTKRTQRYQIHMRKPTQEEMQRFYDEVVSQASDKFLTLKQYKEMQQNTDIIFTELKDFPESLKSWNYKRFKDDLEMGVLKSLLSPVCVHLLTCLFSCANSFVLSRTRQRQHRTLSLRLICFLPSPFVPNVVILSFFTTPLHTWEQNIPPSCEVPSSLLIPSSSGPER